MNIMHKLEIRDGILQNVIYVYYPVEYEFSLDFDSIKTHAIGVAEKIRSYALDNISKFSNEYVLLILNGVVIGTILLTQLVAQTNIKNIPQNISQNVNEKVSIEKLQKIEVAEAILKEEEKVEEVENIEENPYTTTTYYTSTNYQPTSPPSTSQSQNTSNTLTNTTTGTIIPLQLSNGNVIQIGLEEYVIGVVGSEMPAEFSTEALKAQAVAARTYALKKVSQGKILTTNTETQCYRTESELRSMWGESFDKYYTKIKNAVYSTSGECIKYNGDLIDALYFSTSNGKTEDAVNVWGNSIPYLKSVDSSFEIGAKFFYSSKTVSRKNFCEILGIDESGSYNIQILEKTIGDRIKTISIGGKTFDGVKLRTLFGLNSADFTIIQSGDNLIFDVKGYGHGVGMSQRGANILAQRGWSYKDILNYYYTDINIAKI